MSYQLLFASLHSGEIRLFEFPFSGLLASGETLASASVTVSVWSGTDATPSNLKSGSASISGTSVLQNLTGSGGVLGVVYDVVCAATTSVGRILQLRGFVAVVPSA